MRLFAMDAVLGRHHSLDSGRTGLVGRLEPGQYLLRSLRSGYLLLIMLCGCGEKKPVRAHLVAPPDCVRILSSVPLTDDGKSILPKSHFDMEILCTRVIQIISH